MRRSPKSVRHIAREPWLFHEQWISHFNIHPRTVETDWTKKLDGLTSRTSLQFKPHPFHTWYYTRTVWNADVLTDTGIRDMWLLTMRQRWSNSSTKRRAQSKPRSWLKTFLEHSLLLSYVTGSGCPEGLRGDCAWEASYSSTEEWEKGHRGANEWSLLSLLAHITTQDCLEFLSHSLDLKCPSHYWPDIGGRIYGKLQFLTEKYFSEGHTTHCCDKYIKDASP